MVVRKEGAMRHCDRQTNSQMQRKTRIYERVHSNPIGIFNYVNGEFIEGPLDFDFHDF